MAEENQGDKGADEQLTQEQLDAQNAEKYRTQLNGGKSTAQVVEENADDGKAQRPEHIPEKFWDAEKGEVNVEAMAKSYTELEKKGGEKPAPKTEEGEGLTDEQKTEKAEAEKAARETLGLPTSDDIVATRERMTEKLASGEDFADEDYAPFEKLGFDRETIDTFAAGLVALGQVHTAAVYKEAGGEDVYKQMTAWARDEFTAEEIAAYDRDVHSQDKAVSQNAVRGLAARYKLAAGQSGRDVTKSGSGKSPEGYRSKAEMVADMKDPRYQKDEAFREEVARKVASARRAGVNLSA